MNFNDKQTVYSGGTTVQASSPLGTIPLYVREGAIIPRGDIVRLNNNWEANWSPELRLEFFPSGKRKSQFDYYTGSGVQKITAQPEHDGLRIEFGDLGAPGTVEVYCQKVKGVTRNGVKLQEGTDYRYDVQNNKLTVSFQGASQIVIGGAESLF